MLILIKHKYIYKENVNINLIMINIKINDYKLEINNYIYLESPARPSKSLVDTKLYTTYNDYLGKLDSKFLNIFDKFSNIKGNSKYEYFLLNELKRKVKNIQNLDLDFSLDSICINETEEFNIIFNLEKNDLYYNFKESLSSLEKNDIIFIATNSIFSKSELEILLITSLYFNKIKYYYSELYSSFIFIGINFNNNNINYPNNSKVKECINIPKDIINYFYNFNNRFLQEKTNYFKLIKDNKSNLNILNKIYQEKELLFKLNNNKSQCEHIFFDSFYYKNCKICTKCYEIHS